MLDKIKKQLKGPDSYISVALGLAVVLIIGVAFYNYTAQSRQSSQTPQDETAALNDQGLPVALPATHSVKAGDTLWSISELFYKSGYNWVDIAKTNSIVNPDDIKVNQKLNIPNVKPIIPAGQVSSTSTQRPKTESYTVKAGDNLWKIAVDQYNNGYRWSDIARANNLSNPNLIHAGNVLKLP
ncbi:hypothetical protein A2154_03715 [Candidatus Gottesmanbacteria bacterium RBG_16_43_7]|uniref:LysM domain-containing protein n=1 Tax=Candidatus Gottesmanbacteria bacterium RBG_16_43_7 TaxID=1798373 RepID=A0A1F5Z9I4_9BACT|nr:MAG: hypothetical protein A2154_03715 [Candidatus Gottesmanbacteria bacterium RBG_16_43_7]